MKIAICDDEKIAIHFLKSKIELQGNKDAITSFTNTGEMTPERMEEFDLIFMDIEMSEINGIELTNLLRVRQEESLVSSFGSLPLIIFVTGHKEYMRSAFSVHAFDYLIKPVSDEVFQKSYYRAKKYIDLIYAEASVLSIKNGGKTYAVSLSDIKYVESLNRKNIIHFKNDEKIEYYGSMNDLEAELDHRFFRIHKSYIVNMVYIKKYDRTSVTVGIDEILMMSKYRYQDFVESYMNYMIQGTKVRNAPAHRKGVLT